MSGWNDSKDDDPPQLDVESFELFLGLRNEYKFSAQNPNDMKVVKDLLTQKGCNSKLIDGVIWRFKNLSGLC